ncbi:MAG: cysteine--tRNA ligase [Acidimicrobiales bacterium]|nr:cysteine--tRNA ligase [Acidimicrobiales bacterium]
MRLYDTARQEVVPFEVDHTVRMYVCGITPYDSTHLGHANTYLTYDLLIRRLEDRGHTVEMVRNVTDVDDSILPKARELGIDYLELAATEMERFRRDMLALNTRAPIAEPRATESIADIIAIIEKLDAGGHTYQADGITYFDVTTSPTFGELSHYDTEQMITFAGERGGTPDDPRQRNPLDFVLWQPSADDEPSWPSPYGPGRPGWHIECSAMSKATLGTTLDLHGGGSDLIFPHHECEMAQSHAANGEPFVRHWMHCGLVAYQGTKMSKSLGNLVFVSELSKTHDPRAIRWALMAHHYRNDWEWFDHDIDTASSELDQLLAATTCPKGPDPEALGANVRAALDADLDAPAARNHLLDFARACLAGRGDHPAAAAGLVEIAAIVGLELS